MRPVAGNRQPVFDELAEVDDRIGALEARPLDAIDRERLAGLRARRDELLRIIERERLVPEKAAPGSGLWAPLALADASSFEPPRAAVPRVPEPPSVAVEPPQPATVALPGDADREVLEAVEQFLNGSPAVPLNRLRALAKTPALSSRSLRILAATFQRVGDDAEAAIVRARVYGREVPLIPPRAEPSFETVPAHFVPEIDDGFTLDQRRVVEVLAGRGASYAPLDDVLADVAARGMPLARVDLTLAELFLPRRYPVLEVSSDTVHRVRLSSLAREMVSVAHDGEVRLHGAFFPNLLVNGCAEPRVFPTHRLADVFASAERLMAKPVAPPDSLIEAIGGPDLPAPARLATVPAVLYRLGKGVLELHPCRTADLTADGRALRLTWVDQGKAATACEAIESWAASRRLDGVLRVVREDETVSVELEHPVFASQVKRLLRRVGLMTTRYRVQFTVDRGGGPEELWLGALLARFIENCRNEVRRRHLGALDTDEARAQLLRSFLRAIDEPGVVQVLDRCLDGKEVVWALTHLGSSAFDEHPVFGALGVRAAPFELRHAEQIAATPRLVDRRERIVAELERLTNAGGAASSISNDAVDAEVRGHFERILRLVGDDPRRTLLPDRRRVV